ncbi:MAG: TIGR03936 family radical SAM-associated protein [Acidimicrobiales bacterium]
MRIRFRFSKLGKVRWTSHRDVARMWERAIRRAELPVTYTGGFTPRPKISFGLALPTGHESTGEYLDVDFDDARPLTGSDIAGLPARLSLVLPLGVDVSAAAVVDRPVAGRLASLQSDVVSCTWEIEAVGAGPGAVAALIERALAADELVITRDRKGSAVTEDVRPAIESVRVLGQPPCIPQGFVDHSPGALLVAELATQTRNLRPGELLAALSPELTEGHVRRTHQWIMRDGARREPLPLDATDAPHVERRAS